jgi:hypothetical protein
LRAVPWLTPIAMSLLACACGRIETDVGAEFPREAGAEPLPDAVAADAAVEAEAPACTGDLSSVGTGDFHVSLTLATTEPGLVALVNQRRTCDPSVFWDIRMFDGLLDVEVDDVAHYTELKRIGPTINDGTPHAIVAQRIAGTLSASVDGIDAGSGASEASLAALPPVVTGTDVCVTSSDGTVALLGQLTNLCVTSP